MNEKEVRVQAAVMRAPGSALGAHFYNGEHREEPDEHTPASVRGQPQTVRWTYFSYFLLWQVSVR